MTVKLRFSYVWPEGTTPSTIYHWIKTLSKEEQDEFAILDKIENQARQIAIDQGSLVIKNKEHAWRDQEAFEKNRSNRNPIWVKYWQRWLEETGVQFSVIRTDE